MPGNDQIPHLFRSEHGKLVAVLTKKFGFQHLELAEDIASETFLAALEIWPYKGQPANPSAWLYAVASNKVKNYLIRNALFKTKIAAGIAATEKETREQEIDFSDEHISDSQLQMLFVVCHPSISVESQICLALRVLCGLGLSEIADAFLTNPETIHKRLQRAKEKLRAGNIEMQLPDQSRLPERLTSVLRTLYLLFSEGYYSEGTHTIIRKECCFEAMSLTHLLLQNPHTNTHAVNSLMALMCFHASRLEARQSANGTMILYADQDRGLWNTELIERGFYYLQQASRWQVTSNYYLEASIAYWHTVDTDHLDKWKCILDLYDALMILDNSPMIALNRIVAFAKVHGNKRAIQEAEGLHRTPNHFYFVLLGDLYTTVNTDQALRHFQSALSLCKTEVERAGIRKKISQLSTGVADSGKEE